MRGVLFDLDDTLLDYSAARDTGVIAWLNEDHPEILSASAPDEIVARWRDLERFHFDRYRDEHITNVEQRRARVTALVGAADDDTQDARFQRFLTHTRRAWVPFADAIPGVRAAQAVGPVGILTNGTQELQQAKLDHLGLGDVPMLASSSLPAPKPHRRAFAAACDLLGTAPADTVMVGDDLVADVRGALDAGLQAIWVDRAGTGHDPGAPVVASLTDIRWGDQSSS